MSLDVHFESFGPWIDAARSSDFWCVAGSKNQNQRVWVWLLIVDSQFWSQLGSVCVGLLSFCCLTLAFHISTCSFISFFHFFVRVSGSNLMLKIKWYSPETGGKSSIKGNFPQQTVKLPHDFDLWVCFVPQALRPALPMVQHSMLRRQFPLRALRQTQCDKPPQFRLCHISRIVSPWNSGCHPSDLGCLAWSLVWTLL